MKITEEKFNELFKNKIFNFKLVKKKFGEKHFKQFLLELSKTYLNINKASKNINMSRKTLKKYCKKYNIKFKMKRKGGHIWTKEKIIKEAKKIASNNNGGFPKYKKINSSFVMAVYRHYDGGMTQLKKDLDITSNSRKSTIYWKKEENILKEAEKIIEEFGTIPKTSVLLKSKYKKIISILADHHDFGLEELREKFGFKRTRKKKGYWKKEENILKEAEKIIEEFGTIPSANVLIDNDYSSFLNAVKLYYKGGFNDIKKEFGIELTTKPNNYWKKEENILKEAEKIIEEFGTIPSSSILNEEGYYNFISNLNNYHGTINSLREKFGCKKIMSSYEWKVSKILKKLNIEFIPYFRDHKCNYKVKQEFDFYLPNKNLIIEVDGQYHFYNKNLEDYFNADFDYRMKLDLNKHEFINSNNNNFNKLLRLHHSSNYEEIIINSLKNNIDQKNINNFNKYVKEKIDHCLILNKR
jgi:predicted small secreted protein